MLDELERHIGELEARSRERIGCIGYCGVKNLSGAMHNPAWFGIRTCRTVRPSWTKFQMPRPRIRRAKAVLSCSSMPRLGAQWCL